MSAIWGVQHINNKLISEKIGQSMAEKLKIYKFDSFKSWKKNNLFLGCGVQCVTPESLIEVLPLHDEGRELVITADAIIDNREELFGLLNVEVGFQKNITDSELILIAYEKWGKDCPKYLVGDFTFAIWDEKKKILFCARDHVGKRTFYYYYDNEIFAFCTVIKPIFELFDKKPKLNEKWIADFLALIGVVQSIENAETIYEDIYQLEPAHSLTLDIKGIHKKQYWNPLKEIKKLKLKSDTEYEDQFKKVFFEAVHCRLRSIADVGIMLSGGLDSGSTACVAAQKLSAEGKELKAFTSVPMDGYKDKNPKYYITDESEYIQTILDKYKNINIEYCKSEGKDSVSDMETYINILEQPYKAIENSFWVFGITEKAAQSGCKVLLSGQYGNSTISYGDFDMHIKTLFTQGKVFKINREIKGFSRLYNVPEKRIRKNVVRVLLPYNLRRIVSRLINKDSNKYQYSPINKQLIKMWNIDKRLKKVGFNMLPQKFYTLRDTHKFIVNPIAFSQMALYETKLSLAYGIADRDPTRDKRVIEFCLSLPSNQFVRDGQERYLIRRNMKDILPDKVRLNYETTGLQAADWLERLKPLWGNIYSQIKHALNSGIIDSYIDINKLMKELETVKDGVEENYNMRMLLITLVLSKFVEQYSQ